MKIIVAKNSGFCFGVRKAIDAVETRLKDGPVFTYGDIIHNPAVVEELRQKGATSVDSLEKLPRGSVLVIRSHGVPPQIYEQSEKLGLIIEDATCPFVKRIHRIVQQHYEQGYQIIIIGKRNHPEVIGINGWCSNSAIVLYDEKECAQLPHLHKVCVVAQTTLPIERFNAITELLSTKTDECTVYNTVCDTTIKRQAEAEEIAKKCNAVIILGGKHSSNTQKLCEICGKYCSTTINAENPAELSLEKIHIDDIIGIVVGASTPDWMIREVTAIMSELDMTAEGLVNAEPAAEKTEEIESQNNNKVDAATEVEAAVEKKEAVNTASDDSFADAFEKTMVQIHGGQALKGTVVLVSEDEVCVNIGYKTDGLIPRSEFSSTDVNPLDVVKLGDVIEVEVLKVNDGEGNVLLSKKSLESKKLWEQLLNDFEADKDKVYECVGKEAVKGGLITTIQGVRTFIPASHLSTKYVENIETFVGAPLKIKIIEIDKAKKRIIASQKEVLVAEAEAEKKKIWSKLEPGETIHCVVRRLTDFGAFVDIGGADGLIHVTNMAWGRIKHPSELFKIGQEIDAIILSIDAEKERISLGYKQIQPKPWTLATEKYPVGSAAEGKVVRIVPFGAFIALEPSIDGLVHISQVSVRRIAKVEDELKVGDVVRAKVLEVNPEAKRISLSIKELLLEENPELAEQLEKERAEKAAKRAAERESAAAERKAAAERQAAAAAERRAANERQVAEYAEKRSEKRKNNEEADYDLPPVQQATVSLADFFPKIETVDEEPMDE